MAKKSATKRPGRGSDQFIVRLPDGMRDLIAKMAERHGRSMNAEIVSALARYCAEWDAGTMSVDVTDRITKALGEHERPDPKVISTIGKYLQMVAKRLDVPHHDDVPIGAARSKKAKEPRPTGDM